MAAKAKSNWPPGSLHPTASLVALTCAKRVRSLSAGLLTPLNAHIIVAADFIYESFTEILRCITHWEGKPYDNAKAESFMKTLKCEEVYRSEYRDLTDAWNQIRRFIEDSLQSETPALSVRVLFSG